MILARPAAQDYPHVVELTVSTSCNPVYDHDHEFGIDLILDGLERARRAT